MFESRKVIFCLYDTCHYAILVIYNICMCVIDSRIYASIYAVYKIYIFSDLLFNADCFLIFMLH